MFATLFGRRQPQSEPAAPTPVVQLKTREERAAMRALIEARAEERRLMTQARADIDLKGIWA